MSCVGCSVSNGSTPNGCGSKGNCATGGCNRLNTYDWLRTKEVVDVDPFSVVEVSFKNGARKDFFENPVLDRCQTGDHVLVEATTGYDLGVISLSGDLVRLQMKKKKFRAKGGMKAVIRKANPRDLERLQEARELEKPTMTRAKAIARTLSLDMKIGDVEYQGDKRKATFYYTAEGRVDFRELIRHFAKEFKVKIEMRQIGARQESARIGGIGSCGRELCCSTWLSDFKSVTTSAARYQNLAINQSKLSGQCGRLKCCLNFELDTYIDALEAFPKKADKLYMQKGEARLLKMDIFKKLMYFSLLDNSGRHKVVCLKVERVKEILEMNKKGERPIDLTGFILAEPLISDEAESHDYENVGEVIKELPPDKRKKRKKRKPRGRSKGGNNRQSRSGQSKGGPNKKRD